MNESAAEVQYQMCSSSPRGRGQSRLNFDVLRLICNNLIEVSDVLSFSLTCSTLRNGALQRRLRMSPVALPHSDAVEKFHRFIFADPASRAPHLYGLILSPHTDYAPNDDRRFVNYLVAILEAATHLEYLYFATAIGQPVCAAVAELTRLRELVVDACSHGQHKPGALNKVLTDLRSPLRDLTAAADCDMEQISASFLHDNLLHFAPSLSSLTLEGFKFDISPSSITTPFTVMRSLRIDSFDQSHFYQLNVLLRLFPNLNDTLFLRGFTPPVDQYPALREQSREAQRDDAWSGLDRFVCSADLAYLMALRCPIRCMDIDEPVMQEARYITETLRDNCPRQLLLPIILFGHDHLQNLHGLFPSEAADKLTHLVLFAGINFNRRRRPPGECNCFSWDQLMDRVVDALKHLRLTHLRIVFHYHIYPRVPGASCDELCSRNIAHDADLHPAATRLVDRMETLEHVFLTTCGVRRCGQPWTYWHSSKAWRVVPGVEDPPDRRSGAPPSGKRRSCVEISDEAAEAVIDGEGLHLRDREEQMVRHCLEPVSEVK